MVGYVCIITTDNFSRSIEESSGVWVLVPSTMKALKSRETKVEGTSRAVSRVAEVARPDLLHSELCEGSDKAFDIGRDELHTWIHRLY